jgi:hypothetical protein
MMHVSIKVCRLPVACVFLVLATTGCSPSIDRPGIEEKLRKTDPEIKKFLNAFPNATVSFHTPRSMGQLVPDPRRPIVSVRKELPDGYGVGMSRRLYVDSDGVTFDADDHCYFSLTTPNYEKHIRLNVHQFDALLAARGDLGSLKPFGVDFSLSHMDETKVIDGVRKLSPLAVKLHQAFPNNSTWVNKPTYRQSGKFSSSVFLANGVELSVNHDIRVAADGFSVELVAESNKEIPGRLRLYVPSAGDIGSIDGESSINLTSEQFNRIVAAKGASHVVRQVWSERPRPKPQDMGTPDPDGKEPPLDW